MADERLRALERRWRESGALTDEVVYLRERLRRGDLSQERLTLAAFLGHPAALEVMPNAMTMATDAPAWSAVLTGFGRETFVRAALVAARLDLERSRAPSRDLGAALASVEAWLRCPCARHSSRALAAGAVGLGNRRSHAHCVAEAAGSPSLTEAARAAVQVLGSAHTFRVEVVRALLSWALGPTDVSGAIPPGVSLPILWVEVPAADRAALERYLAQGTDDAQEELLTWPRARQVGLVCLAVQRIAALVIPGSELVHVRDEMQLLREMANRLLKRRLPWTPESLAPALRVADGEHVYAFPLSGLLRAASSLASDVLTPELEEAIRLHVVETARGLLGPTTPAALAQLGTLLRRPRPPDG